MIGEPKSRATLEGEIKAKTSLVGDAEVGRVVIKREDLEEYKGDYIVTPTGNRQILETANKKLTDDVTVNAIPYETASNAAGGITVTIAGSGS